MEGDMMGGPFVSHAHLDEKNQRVVVAETFVYAPGTKKRNCSGGAKLRSIRLHGLTEKKGGRRWIMFSPLPFIKISG